ncbi:Hsp20/alpha crystallin family protein [Kordia sp. YSTF-M3]|uniref:Hsp20/alpha crystallin family protein n=1 Tax=Kordia aestuariivivens TaxID=2759037 RepID=A0ABR7QH86_9FLAO|nr:Hsp20/alpha crystallin family protein [Kordia aestuariivivens]MBC8757684.1 Hsp20/alpha crystallin family protein [Kordia aestuariivivens]
MNIVKRKHADFPSIFDELFQTDWFGGIANQVASTTNIPATNIKETADNFILEVATPGKTKEDFMLALDHDVLTISTETKKEEIADEATSANEKYTRKEFSFESFKRSFKLPQTVNKEAINATYTNGILSVALPKREEDKVKPKRTIEIS